MFVFAWLLLLLLLMLLLLLFWWCPSLRLRASAMSLSSSLSEGMTLRDVSIASYETCVRRRVGNGMFSLIIFFFFFFFFFLEEVSRNASAIDIPDTAPRARRQTCATAPAARPARTRRASGNRLRSLRTCRCGGSG